MKNNCPCSSGNGSVWRRFWFFTIAMIILVASFIAISARADDDNPEDVPLPRRIHRIHMMKDLKPVVGTTNFYYVTLTEPGHYRFILHRKRVIQVVNGFPFSIDPFFMTRGDRWTFTLPRNYQPYTIVFIDWTGHDISLYRP